MSMLLRLGRRGLSSLAIVLDCSIRRIIARKDESTAYAPKASINVFVHDVYMRSSILDI